VVGFGQAGGELGEALGRARHFRLLQALLHGGDQQELRRRLARGDRVEQVLAPLPAPRKGLGDAFLQGGRRRSERLQQFLLGFRLIRRGQRRRRLFAQHGGLGGVLQYLGQRRHRRGGVDQRQHRKGGLASRLPRLPILDQG